MNYETGSASTSQRIKEMQQRRLGTAMFLSGLFIVLLVICAFGYIHDSAYLGETNPFKLWKPIHRSVFFVRSAEGWLPNLNYMISAAGRTTRIIDATSFLYISLVCITLASIFNGFIRAFAGAFARSQIRRQLAPLYELTKNAQRLTNESDPKKAGAPISSADGLYDENRIHNFENAIDSMKTDLPNSRLKTGDQDLKGLENAINSLLERTRSSYSQQIRFVSDASHELRTPIAVIKGYTDMLDRWGKQDEKILDESIDAIKTETDHMNRLVEQLLFLARGDSGRTKLIVERFSLSDMIREVYEESMMIDSDHAWEVYADREVIAQGDSAMLKQATRILVDNASKYTPQGESVIIKAIIDEKGAPTVVVQDNGIGIDDENMSHIFDRFYRADSARTKGGTGLGLAIAKWIVDQHQGYFDITSREDVGTRIRIHLPIPQDEPII